MNAKALRNAAGTVFLAFASVALAQAPAGGSAGQGARDGSRPSDGAITGGSIAPGETGGVPDGGKGPGKPSDRAISRCNDLTGTLREQCLLQEQGASTGGTRAPEIGVAKPPPPREAPPPQNPRP
jgi:hypothetical protein